MPLVVEARVMKPFSPSCVENQEPIFSVLAEIFADRRHVLEIGSGTGQHAVYFGERLPHLVWQTGDLAENHAGIRAWVKEAGLPNVRLPLGIDALAHHWDLPARDGPIDAIFSANAVHIMSWAAVEGMFAKIGAVLAPGGVVCLYGPFNYDGKFTSESNARFDQWLKMNDPESGVRDFEKMNALATAQGLKLVKDVAMPANNRTLVWKRG